MWKIVESKWGKKVLWFFILLTFCIWGYIVLFVGTANTLIDNFCLIICLTLMNVLIVRNIVVDINEMEEER